MLLSQCAPTRSIIGALTCHREIQVRILLYEAGHDVLEGLLQLAEIAVGVVQDLVAPGHYFVLLVDQTERSRLIFLELEDCHHSLAMVQRLTSSTALLISSGMYSPFYHETISYICTSFVGHYNNLINQYLNSTSGV